MRKKLLFLNPRLPYPLIGGDRIKVYHLLRYLSTRYEVTFVCFIESLEQKANIEKILEFNIKLKYIYLPPLKTKILTLLRIFNFNPLQVNYYYTNSMKKLIDFILKEEPIDIIFVQLLRMAEYVKEVKSIPKILALEDSLILSFKRSLKMKDNPMDKIWRFWEYQRLKAYEPKIVDFFDAITVVSPKDKEIIQNYNRNVKIHVIPNGVDLEEYEFHEPKNGENNIIFVGKLDVYHNIDTVLYFVHVILPQIKSKINNLKFFIVGKNPTKKIRKLHNNKDIIVTGEVKDIKPYVYNSAVFINPIRTGAGIQNKILESMALGTPVVTTPVGVEGIEATNGKNILIADNEQEFAQKVILLLQNKKLNREIALNARKLIEEKYTWEKIFSKVEEVIATIT